jgi:hypothetical protein
VTGHLFGRGRGRGLLMAETGLAGLTGAVGLLTIVVPDWIEEAFGVAPDRDSGAVEWAVVAGLLLISLVSGLMARARWRGLKLRQAPPVNAG